MNLQPPLNHLGSDMRSPLFTPRPGWGGQIREMLRGRAGILIFRGVLVVAIAIAALSLFQRPESHDQQKSTQTPTTSTSTSPAPAVIIIGIRSGDTFSSVAARAIDWYLNTHREALFPVERIWAINRLVAKTKTPAMISGQSIEFAQNDVIASIGEAKSLTQIQRENLAPYIK